MSKLSEELAIEDGLHEEDLGEEDYGFILGPDGELKSIFLPNCMPDEVPEKIAQIFRIFGYSDPDQFGDETLH
jgi:hypothetical protein